MQDNAENICKCRDNSTMFVRGNLTASHIPRGLGGGSPDIIRTEAHVGDIEKNPL